MRRQECNDSEAIGVFRVQQRRSTEMAAKHKQSLIIAAFALLAVVAAAGWTGGVISLRPPSILYRSSLYLPLRMYPLRYLSRARRLFLPRRRQFVFL